MNKNVALITGGARRIGAVITEFLHQQGMSVAIHCHASTSEANRLAEKLNTHRANSAFVVCEDLQNFEQYQKLIESVIHQFGRLDVLINNASVFYPTPFEKATSDMWKKMMDVNLKSPFFLTQAALPFLQENSGCIVNITDIHAQKPLKFYNLYSMSQASLKMMTESLAKDLAPNVRVNAVAPGAILWPEKHADISLQEKILNKIPLKRQGDPVDIGKTVWFLIDSPYVTGQTIVVDGGRLLD